MRDKVKYKLNVNWIVPEEVKKIKETIYVPESNWQIFAKGENQQYLGCL